MNTTMAMPTGIRRHMPLVLLRVVLAAGLFHVMPWAHVALGSAHPGDRQEALAGEVLFSIVGIAAAIVFFAAGTVLQYDLRRRPRRWTAVSDCGLWAVMAGALVYGGATARY